MVWLKSEGQTYIDIQVNIFQNKVTPTKTFSDIDRIDHRLTTYLKPKI